MSNIRKLQRSVAELQNLADDWTRELNKAKNGVSRQTCQEKLDECLWNLEAAQDKLASAQGKTQDTVSQLVTTQTSSPPGNEVFFWFLFILACLIAVGFFLAKTSPLQPEAQPTRSSLIQP